MVRRSLWVILLHITGLAAGCLLGTALPIAAATFPLHTITLPAGFRIQVYAAPVPDARSMVLSPDGTLFVSSRRAGNVYAIRDHDGDYQADTILTIAKGLQMPNGVALHGDSLYVADVNRILRYDNITARLHSPPEPVVILDNLPGERHHGWRVARFGPDGWLYVAIGAPCNVCERDDRRFAAIVRLRPDGSNLEVYAHGIRDSIGFDWHPQTHHLWFTDNGRDWLGDEQPPDELNHAPQPGLHFGFPYCHGKGIADPQYGKKRSCDETVAPSQLLGPHVAALGMRFYTGTMFPSSYRQQIFIAEHGSWNRSTPIGYRVMRVRLEGDRAVEYSVFAEGWLRNGEPWGRPVDVQEMPDGSLLVSDDYAGAIYRISYAK